MKNFILIVLLAFSVTTGIVSGIAYERYVHREDCLRLAFGDSGVESLSEEEIDEITRALNSNDSNPSAVGSGLRPEPENSRTEGSSQRLEPTSETKYVGSKNSNKFYPVDCRYAKLIKEENKVFFGSIEEGEKQGRLYVDCK